MNLNMFALAIPFFSGFILLEYYISRKKNLPYFNRHNSVANLSVGIAMISFALIIYYTKPLIQNYLQIIYPGHRNINSMSYVAER